MKEIFPRLIETAYQITSPMTDTYNCIAWAFGDSRQRWWPSECEEDGYWPSGCPREETLDAFHAAAAFFGYAPCDHEEIEANYEKIALFADATGFPTHAARQLPNGKWTSKIGELEDIEHHLHDLEGTAYGAVVRIMKRPRKG